MIILGIETSCDETAAAVVEGNPSTGSGLVVLSDVVASSSKMHEKTGGIIPEIAARKQIESIIPVIKEAFKISGKKPNDLDALAVTVGPGLIGSLLVGVETAKSLSYSWNKPIIPVNHLVAHFYANWFGEKIPQFPAVGLVVSGGHTDLVFMEGHGQIELLGSTRDDAAGEAFDKTARLLGLPYPGGPAIAETSLKANLKDKLRLFPRPLIGMGGFDFSFSGLKTAVLNETKGKKLNSSYVSTLSAEIQEAVVDVLVAKTLKAIEIKKPKSLLLAGGVAANLRLGEKMKMALVGQKTSLFIPEPKLCTDNATYIASFAEFNYKPASWQKISANPQLTIID